MPEKNLSALLQGIISDEGPISVGTFMAMALGHPQYGYYMTNEPFGENGDFTTAPEISQLFGEMLSVWAMSIANQMPQKELQLIELGPGRGTLMHDLWRGLLAMPELREHIKIHLVEFSPRLRDLQKQKLADLPVTWHENFETVPQRPSIIIANELFDALPVEQAVYHDRAWHQRLVTFDEEDFLFTIGQRLQGIHVAQPKDGDIFEYAPVAMNLMEDLCYFLRRNSGAMAVIDYGDDVALDERIGETLQALYEHKPCSPLEHVGNCDVTAHVAFQALIAAAHEQGCDPQLATQREFLTQLGIRLRADKLLAKANLDQARALKSGLERLVAPDQMGDLFKVLTVISP